MPKIALGTDGAKQQFKVLKGKAEVVLFTHRPTWHYRQYIAKERRYVTRSLETTDLEQAREDAIELFYALKSQLDASGAPDKSQALIKDLIKEWIKENEERQRTGQITLFDRVDNTATSLRLDVHADGAKRQFSLKGTA